MKSRLVLIIATVLLIIGFFTYPYFEGFSVWVLICGFILIILASVLVQTE